MKHLVFYKDKPLVFFLNVWFDNRFLFLWSFVIKTKQNKTAVSLIQQESQNHLADLVQRFLEFVQVIPIVASQHGYCWYPPKKLCFKEHE